MPETYLGWPVHTDSDDAITINQPHQVYVLIAEAGIEHCNPMRAPFSMNAVCHPQTKNILESFLHFVDLDAKLKPLTRFQSSTQSSSSGRQQSVEVFLNICFKRRWVVAMNCINQVLGNMFGVNGTLWYGLYKIMDRSVPLQIQDRSIQRTCQSIRIYAWKDAMKNAPISDRFRIFILRALGICPNRAIQSSSKLRTRINWAWHFWRGPWALN